MISHRRHLQSSAQLKDTLMKLEGHLPPHNSHDTLVYDDDKAAVIALYHLFGNSARLGSSVDLLNEEIEFLGIPRDKATLIANVYGKHKEAIRMSRAIKDVKKKVGYDCNPQRYLINADGQPYLADVHELNKLAAGMFL